LVRVEVWEVTGTNPDEFERGNERGQQWWSLEALRTCRETVFPESLAAHLEPILRDEIPLEPLNIGLEGTKFRTPIEAVEAGYRSAGEWCDTLASVRAEMGSRDERDRSNLDADSDTALAEDLF
jgi:hypothetical protein